MVATRRNFSTAVAAWRSDGRASAGEREARRGPRPAKRLLGQGEALREHRRGAEAGRATCAAGPKARRRPANEKNPFFIYIFKKFLNAIFQILF